MLCCPPHIIIPDPYLSPIIAGANVIGVSMKDGKEALLRNIAEMCRTVSPQPKIVTLNYPHHPTAHTFEIGFSKKLSSSQNDSVENKPFDN
ncbi:hypothetical protein CSA56_17665, partial [candidate division KSB3 bacterium]